MIELRYRLVDVFSDQPLAGNALCVVLDPCPEPVMPAIAREVNLSETAFVTVTGAGEYDARIFTPTAELRFAGHPTLGAAWTLGAGRWTQRTEGGSVVVDVDETSATMIQPDPGVTEIHREEPAEALGAEANGKAFVAENTGIRHVLVPTESPLDHIRPDLARLRAVARSVRATGVAAFRPIDSSTIQARVFIPASTVPEDPGTGSAASPIGVVANERWGLSDDVVIQQGDHLGRPCRIRVHVEPGDMRVGGDVAPCAQGTFTL